MLVIKSDNFASSSHLLCEKSNFVWSTEVPKDAVFADPGLRSLRELAMIFGHDVEPFIPPNYKKSAEIIGTVPPWYFYIGKEKFINRVKEYTKIYSDFRNKFDLEQIEIHQAISSFLETLEPAYYNQALIDPEYTAHFQKSIQPFLIGNRLPIP